MAQANEGGIQGMVALIQETYYERDSTPAEQRPKLAYNVTLGMRKYGLLEADASLTSLGRDLLMADDEDLYSDFARHILVNLNGTALVRCAQDMQMAGEAVTLPNLRDALLERGIHTPSANKHMSLMRLWLQLGGVVNSRWVVNQKVLDELLGLSASEIDALQAMTKEQAAVCRFLADWGEAPVDSSKLRKAVQTAYGVRINEKQMPRDVLIPLCDLGFVEFTSGKARSAPVVATEKLRHEVTMPLLEQLSGSLPPRLLELLRLPLDEIVGHLDGDSHEKGLALEALAFKMLRVVGLDYVDTRYRPRSGGRFEVDLVFQSSALAYSRWQVQCKNTGSVSLDDIAKEVGLTYHLLSNAIIVITRGVIGPEARNYATDVMRKTNLAIILLDGQDVEEVVHDPLQMLSLLAREADWAMKLKPLTAD
jgi:site-specific DNA-methyltransferase (cytosine-N4-specific)